MVLKSYSTLIPVSLSTESKFVLLLSTCTEYYLLLYIWFNIIFTFIYLHNDICTFDLWCKSLSTI